MKESEIDQLVVHYKTMCCKADWKVIKSFDFGCKKCGKNVTIELLHFIDILLRYKDIKKNNWWNNFKDWFVNLIN